MRCVQVNVRLGGADAPSSRGSFTLALDARTPICGRQLIHPLRCGKLVLFRWLGVSLMSTAVERRQMASGTFTAANP